MTNLNRTLYNFPHETYKIQTRSIYRGLFPLFEINIAYYRQEQFRLFRHRIQKFDRVLVMNAYHTSNARRSVLLNKTRAGIIQLLNRQGKKQLMYQIVLSRINEYVPQQELLTQLSFALKHPSSSLRDSTGSVSNPEVDLIRDALFPYEHAKWMQILRSHTGNRKGYSMKSLQKKYLQMQLYNAYKIKYHRTESLFEDIDDFRRVLEKFNFFRFFYSLEDNQFKSKKKCEALIKKIDWRTQETRHYLLFMLRTHTSWEQTCLIIDNFCLQWTQLNQQR